MAALLVPRLRAGLSQLPQVTALFSQLRMNSTRTEKTKLYSRDDTGEFVRRSEDFHSSQRPCPICSRKIVIDYKDVRLLSQFVSRSSGAILRRSTTGVCAKQQRQLAKAIKQARNFGLMPCISRHSLLKSEDLNDQE